MERGRGKVSARYDLTPGQRKACIDHQLSSIDMPRTGVECYGVAGGTEMANVARSLEREIFEKSFGNDSERMHQEYGPYEGQSVFFLSIDAARLEPVGVLRVIENGPSGFKTLHDLADPSRVVEQSMRAVDEVAAYHHIENLDDCMDVGTVAVQPAYRKTNVATQLYRAMYKYALESDKQHIISAIDTRPLGRMTQYLGIPFVPLAGTPPCEYLGSESTQFVYAHVPELFPRMLGRFLTSPYGLLSLRHSLPLVFGTGDRKIHN